MARKNKKDDFIADSDEELEQASGSDDAEFRDDDEEDVKPKLKNTKPKKPAKDVKPKVEKSAPAAKVRSTLRRVYS